MAARSISSISPSIIRCAGAIEIGPVRTSVRERPQRRRRASFSTSIGRKQDERVQHRYGSAKKPPAHFLEREGRDMTSDRPVPSRVDEEQEQNKLPSPPKEGDRSKKEIEPAAAVLLDEATPTNADTIADAWGQGPASTVASIPDELPNAQQAPSSKSMATVLNMPPPENIGGDRPPHLTPPPYVHHFDTYSLVKKLDGGGFSGDQSTIIMKAVRTILADNMDLARRGLVSKSNVENETYLFRAACSELKTEIENNRKGELDKNRTRRALLQHEVDILGQRITQETGSLKDELKGMFDDRKLTVRAEQRNMDNKIQELNYKITVALNSDAKTEVEGVRWVLTRRAATALGASVLMILATLNYTRYMSATQDKERKQHEELMKHASTSHHETTSMGTQTEPTSSSGEALIASEGVHIG